MLVKNHSEVKPQVWCTGPNPLLHLLHQRWSKKKAYCTYKKQEWNLSFKDYLIAIKDHYHQLGVKSGCYQLKRINLDGPWQLDNVQLIQLTRKK